MSVLLGRTRRSFEHVRYESFMDKKDSSCVDILILSKFERESIYISNFMNLMP